MTEHKQHGFRISRRAYVDFVAGCCGGAAGTLVGHPFDTVKVAGLYKGLTAPLLGLAGMNAIVFGVHGNAMRYIQPGARSEAMAGALAGAFQTLIVCPVELAKTRLQMQGKGTVLSRKQKTYKGTLDCLLKIYRNEGIQGCYRGMVSTVIRDVPGFAFYFWLYHTLCHLFIPRGKTINELTTLQLLFCGGVTGCMSWGSTYPFDVIKSRIQADGIAPVGKYKSNLDCVRMSLKQNGYKVFFRGVSVCLVRAFPVNAVTFATVEATLKIVDKSPTLSVEELDL